jgi:hypothetical protein
LFDPNHRFFNVDVDDLIEEEEKAATERLDRPTKTLWHDGTKTNANPAIARNPKFRKVIQMREELLDPKHLENIPAVYNDNFFTEVPL